MSIDLPLDQMSVAEKMEAIEAIWSSIKPTDVSCPDWHAEVLAERKRRLESGEASVIPWEEAKRRLQSFAR
jgi:hypothetical protein